MSINTAAYETLCRELDGKATLVAVSKTKPASDIEDLYALGQRDFGENYVQELVDKSASLPQDIRWHFIGHLQSNKVKYIAPFVHLIHGVDSLSLLKEINKQGAKLGRIISCLLQIHIASEETKFGLDAGELDQIIQSLQAPGAFEHVTIEGLMGMASFTSDLAVVENEFRNLHQLYQQHQSIQTSNCQFTTLSMGMSGDYALAVSLGSNMVRIGSLLFGSRNA